MSEAVPQKIVSGDAAILARRYSGALYALADEQKLLDAVTADLRALRTLADESTEFRVIAHHPRLTRKNLVAAAQSIAEAAQFNPLTSNFLALVAQHRRLNIIGAIIDSFLDELATKRDEHTAYVRSAYPLTTEQQEKLTIKLRELAGGKVFLSLSQDKNLLGGFTAKLGSRLIDASIKSKLERLERQLKAGRAA